MFQHVSTCFNRTTNAAVHWKSKPKTTRIHPRMAMNWESKSQGICLGTHQAIQAQQKHTEVTWSAGGYFMTNSSRPHRRITRHLEATEYLKRSEKLMFSSLAWMMLENLIIQVDIERQATHKPPVLAASSIPFSEILRDSSYFGCESQATKGIRNH